MATQAQPTIVIAAWNRPRSLQRLLNSLAKCNYPPETRLHISIDHFPRNDVVEIAQQFEWKHGEKIIEQHHERLGLRKHILHCGGLTATYDAIILLEDDLLVSPEMYAYASKSLTFFENSPAIAGISLYHYQVAESCHQPFEVWQDGFDNYFLQLPSSWGAAFSKANWDGFVAWMSANYQNLPQLPAYIQNWSQQSWKKLFAAYLIATNKYFSYPKIALSTNSEDFGVHANTAGLFEVSLLMGEKKWNLALPTATKLRYDTFFEPNAEFLKEIQPLLQNFDFDVDLLGQKAASEWRRPFILTSQKGGEAKLGFSKASSSDLQSIWLGKAGEALRLVPSTADLQPLEATDFEFGQYLGQSKAALLHLPEVRMPSYTVIFVQKTGENESESGFQALLQQGFAGLEIIALVPKGQISEEIWQAHVAGQIRLMDYSENARWKGIQAAVKAASGNLIQILDAGNKLKTGIIEEIAKIFRQFPGLEWLSALPIEAEGKALSKLISYHRWDTDRFGLQVVKTEALTAQTTRIEAEIAAWLPLHLQVYRRALWMRNASETKNEHTFLRQLSAHSLPTVATICMLEVAETNTAIIPQKSGLGKVNATRGFYHRHIPLLWKLHRKWSDYEAVLRYDAGHGTWYLFGY